MCDNTKIIEKNHSKTMANTPSSIEVQIDNFLEHFKRSASKAMDTDWISSESQTNYSTTAAVSFNHSTSLKTMKTRSSCFDITQLSSNTGNKQTTHSKSFLMTNKPHGSLMYVGYLSINRSTKANR